MKILKNIFFLSGVLLSLFVITIFGCNDSDNSEKIIRDYLEKEKSIKHTIERISKEKFPKITWYDKEEFFVDGIRYIMYRRSSGGENLINYTKDSLEIEFYKHELNKGQKPSF